MNNINFNEINKELNLDSKIMYCYMDDAVTPPFMCSKSFEQWLYSDNWKDILGNLFEKVISVFLPGTLDILKGIDLYDGEQHDLLESIKVYKQYTNNLEEKSNALKYIENCYNNLLTLDVLNTVDVVNILQELKANLNILGIEFDYEVYDNVKLASKSKLISNKEFDENNLESNFVI